MNLTKIICFLVVSGLLVDGEYLVCIPGVCKRVRCPKITRCNENQMLLKRATRCRCCSVCVPLLNFGEACLRIKHAPTAKCRPGLRCINRRCLYQRFHNPQMNDTQHQ